MSDPKNKSSYHHGDLKEHLLDSVRQLVEEKGPDGFSIVEASRAAGVSTAAPYKHFKDRSEIVRAVAVAGMRRFGQAVFEAQSTTSGSDPDKIVAMASAYVNFARREPGIFRLMWGLKDSEEDAAAMLEAGRPAYGILIAQVAAFFQLPTEHPKVRMKSYVLWSFIHGHSFLQIDNKDGSMNFDELEQEFLVEVTRKALE